MEIYNPETDPTFWLKNELDHFIEVGKEYDRYRLPEENKRLFIKLLIYSINDIFRISQYDPWTGHQNEAWKTILDEYGKCASYDETVKAIQKKIMDRKEESRMASICAERDRWRYEND